MGRKSKVQTVVENFETEFENLVQECLSDVDLYKAEGYFSNSALYEAVCDIVDNENEDEDEDEDNKADEDEDKDEENNK